MRAGDSQIRIPRLMTIRPDGHDEIAIKDLPGEIQLPVHTSPNGTSAPDQGTRSHENKMGGAIASLTPATVYTDC